MQQNRNLIYLIIQTNQMYQLDKQVQLQYFQLQLNIQVYKSTSVLIEIILVLLYLKKSCPFVIVLLRVYCKKYKILLLSNIYDALKVMNCNLSLTFYVNRKLNQMNYNNLLYYIPIKRIKVKKKFKKFENSFITNNKIQLESQKSLVNLLNSQSTSRLAMLGLDQKAQKIIRLEKN